MIQDNRIKFSSEDKILILSGCDQGQREYGDLLASKTREYAARHGYDFQYSIGSDFYFVPGLGIDSLEQQDPEKQFKQTRAHNWNKVSLVSSNLYYYDYVLWLDSDAMIQRPEQKLDEVFNLTEGKDFYLAPDAESLNVGVFLVRSTEFTKRLFTKWVQMGIEKNEYFSKGFCSGDDICFYEQAAFSHLYYTNWENLMVKTQIEPPKIINSHFQFEFWRGPANEYFQHDSKSFIVHMAGLNHSKRVEIVNRFTETGKISYE